MDQPTKTCRTCRVTMPVTDEFFYFRKDSGRFRDECKDCFKRAKSERYWRDPEHARRISMDSYYSTDGASAKRRAVAANPERYAEINERYEAAHRDERLEARRVMHEERRDEENARARQWYADNRERAIASSRAVLARNPERSKMFAHRTRAKRRSAVGEHSTQELLDRLAAQLGTCPYCEGPLGTDPELEHVEPLSRGGSNSIENIVYACRRCNRSKFSWTLEEWLSPEQAVAVRLRVRALTGAKDADQ